MKGPVAPKDPTRHRAKIYLMLEDLLYTSHKAPQGERYAEMIFLENRVGPDPFQKSLIFFRQDSPLDLRLFVLK